MFITVFIRAFVFLYGEIENVSLFEFSTWKDQPHSEVREELRGPQVEISQAFCETLCVPVLLQLTLGSPLK